MIHEKEKAMANTKSYRMPSLEAAEAALLEIKESHHDVEENVWIQKFDGVYWVKVIWFWDEKAKPVIEKHSKNAPNI